MNPDELREHLRTTLDPVGTPAPSVRSLRAVVARRMRQNRWAAGVLAVVVLAGGGVGIGLATRGGGGTDRVMPAASFPASAVRVVGDTVSVPCSSGSVTVDVGQQLDVSCPLAGGAGPYIRAKGFDPSVLTDVLPSLDVVRYVFPELRADSVGDTTVTLVSEPACATQAHCSTSSTVVGTIGVHVVAPAGSTSPLRCVDQSATVTVGSGLTLTACSRGARPTSSDESVATATTTQQASDETVTLHALAVGSAVVRIAPTIGCAAPADCPTITIQLTVVAGSGARAVACATGAVTLSVGQQLSISGCQPQAEFTDSDEAVLAPGVVPETYPTPLPVFTAKKPGTVTIGLSRRPVCVAGGACSQLVQVVGTITVTVRG